MKNTWGHFARSALSILRSKAVVAQAEITSIILPAVPVTPALVGPLPGVINPEYYEDTAAQFLDDDLYLPWPVVGLPVEIMIVIFEYACGCYDPLVSPFEEHKTTVRVDLARLRMPFVIASTTSSWRILALNTPSLWTYICLPAVDYSHLKPTAKYEAALARMSSVCLRLLSTQLQRSGSAPLDVRIPCFHFCLLGGPEGPSTAASAVHTQALIALAPHVGRIRSLWIAPARHPIRFWQLFAYEVRHTGWREGGAARLAMPALEALVIERGSVDMLNAIEPRGMILDIHLDAPRLVTAMLQHNISLLLPPTRPSAQIKLALGPLALRELTVWEDPELGIHLYPLLTACSGTLETLSINLSGAHGSNSFNPSAVLQRTPKLSISFPHVRDFTLESSRLPECNRDLLRVLDMPTLRRAVFVDTAALRLLGDQVRSPLDAFLEFIHPGVEELEVSISRDGGFEAWMLDADHAKTIKERFVSLDMLRVKAPTVISHEFLAALGVRALEDTPAGTKRQKKLVLECVNVMVGASDLLPLSEHDVHRDDSGAKLLRRLTDKNNIEEAATGSNRSTKAHVDCAALLWG